MISDLLDTMTPTRRRHAVLQLLMDYQWHTTIEINQVGGTEGTRRLRELRQAPFCLNIERSPAIGSRQWQYRIVDPKS